MSASKWETHEEINIFREYLRIPSVHPNVDYTACVDFLKRQATSLGLPVDVIYPALKTKPVVIIKWLGSLPDLPSIMLNSHMDVVPVFPNNWTHGPFSADLDNEGRIYARGSQDMKCIGTQYLGAIRMLKSSKYQPKRTVFVTYVPDEESGGPWGMSEFVKGDYFKKLNVGFVLDEGMPSEDDVCGVFYAERTMWQIRFIIRGTSGHGLLLLPQTAGEKFAFLLNKLTEFRTSQVEMLEQSSSLDVGDVTTVNLTQLQGGVQTNVVPPSLEVVFDIRISINENLVEFERQLRCWCEEAGGGIELQFEEKFSQDEPTIINGSNPYWFAFKQALDEIGLKCRTRVFPGGTDSYYIRQVGIPALGFTPINNATILMHDHNEYLKAETYLKGIEIYQKVIAAVVSV